MAGKIFVSYASERRDVAEPIALALRSAGYDVFFDRDDLPPGQSYHDQIAEAIGETDVMVFLLSPESVDKGRYTLSEVGIARKKWRTPKGRVLPVMLAPTSIEELPAYLREVSVLDSQGNLVADTVNEVNTLFDALRKAQTRKNINLVTKVALVGILAAGLFKFGAPIVSNFLHDGYQSDDMDIGRQVSRTPNIGLQFMQNGQLAHTRMIEDETDERYGEVIVLLERAPFEIRVPESHWTSKAADLPAMQVAVSDSEDIFDMMVFDADRRETPYLEDGSGMADNEFGSGALMTYHSEYADCCWGHNYISDGRFNTSAANYRGIFISSINHRITQEDLMQSDDQLFMSVYLSNDGDLEWMDPDELEPIETEWIELIFLD